MGNVLETRSASSHTPIELNLAMLKFRNDGVFKTRRFNKHATNASLIRYVTQDRGKSVEATALVTVPSAASNASATYPVLLFLHGTAGFNDACSPTRPIAESSNGGFSDPTGLIAALMASYGYVTIFPDYLGLKSFGPPSNQFHPYLVGEPTAIASLDAVRATLKNLAGGPITPGPLLVVGASQGGHGAAFVDRLAPHYAPELAITAAAWLIPPTDLVGQMRTALPAAGKAWANTAAFLVGAESWYGASANGLTGALLPPYDVLLHKVWSTDCGSSDALSGATPLTVFTNAFLAAAALPTGAVEPFTCYARENSVTTTSVPHASDVPTMFVVGELDTLVQTAVERASFQTLCGQGYRLAYRECAGLSHTASFFGSWDEWFDFFDQRVAGEPFTGTCVLNAPATCASAP